MRRWQAVAVLTWLTAGLAQTAPTPEQKLEQAVAQLEKAEKLVAQGQTDEAVALAKAVRQSLGEQEPWLAVRAWLIEGYAGLRSANWRQAETAFSELAGKFGAWPEVPEALQQLARAYSAQGKDKEARETYLRIIAEAPHSYPRLAAERQLLALDLKTGDLPAAEQRLDALLQAFPWLEAAPFALLELGEAWLAKDQPAKALQRLEQVRTSYPGTEPAFTARRLIVDALGQLKQPDEALKLLTAVETQTPEMFVVADVCHLRADVLDGAGRWQEAVAALDPVATRYPGSALAVRAVTRQAELLQKHDQRPAAIQRLEALAKALPAPYWQVQLLPALVELYRQGQQVDQAEDATAALVKLTDGTAVAAGALLELAQIQRDAGRKKSAKGTAEKVVQTYKGAPVVPLAEDLLAQWAKADKAPPPGR